MANQLSVKVYYVENKATKEIRKFSVDEDVSASFEYIVGKIRQVFPNLSRKEVELFWKDDEEDYVSVSSSDELFQALKAIPTGTTCLKLFVKVKQVTKPAPNEVHLGVTCDSCDANINGIRYKCTVCEDFDLCSTCENKGSHPDDHELLCIKKPRSSATFYVMRSRPFTRGCMRGRGPWSGQGGPCGSHGGPLSGRSGPWFGGRGGPWTARGGLWCDGRRFAGGPDCSFGAKNFHKKPETERDDDKQEHQNEEPFKKMISQLAVVFGLDPEVAVSSAKSFLDNFHTKDTTTSGETEKHPEGKPEHSDSDIGFDAVIIHIAESFGLNPELVKDTASSMFCHCHPQQTNSQPREEKKTEEKEKTEEETTSSVNTEVNIEDETANSEEQTSQNKDDNMETEVNKSSPEKDGKSDQHKAYEDMVSEFSEQFGFSPEMQQAANHQFSNLRELMGELFQSFTPPQSNSESPKTVLSKEDADDDEETSEKSDDFIVVDQQSAEEKYEQRLGKALRQMEAMGFDNEGGWLRQLLVSKDLSIGRVLDAVNPPM